VTQIEKLVERLRRARGEADYADLHRLLQHYGWTRERQAGSHVTYKKAGQEPISFPLLSGRWVKSSYRRLVLRRLGFEAD